MAAHDAVHGSQSQAAASELGSEEWVENMFFDVLVHAATGIMHFQANVHAVPVRDPAHTRSDLNKTGFIADRLSGIDNQVHHQLLHLARIRLD